MIPGAAFEQPRGFLDAQHLAHRMRAARGNEASGKIPPPQGHRVEEAQRRDGAVDCTRVGAALVLVDLEFAQVLGRGGIGRTLEESGKALDVAHILVLRAGREPAHHHIVLHPLAQRTDGGG